MACFFYHVYLLGILSVFLQIHGDSSYSQDVMFEYLDNCDPNVDPVCKEKIETIRDQIAVQLTGNSDKKVKTETNGNKASKIDPKVDLNQDNTVNFPKKTVDNESVSNVLSKKTISNKDQNKKDSDDIPGVYFLIIIIACTLTGVAGIALSGYCWYKLHNSDEKGSKKEYIPGVKKTNGKGSPIKNGDHKLDYKAEMYHYVHTKNQIAAMEKAKSDHLGNEDLSNDEEDEVEDYTVYECPGLAPTGDMTVVNPLFSDQEVTGSDDGPTQSNRSSPSTPPRSLNNSSH